MAPRNIFISHAHTDNVLCDPFVEALRARGVDVWYDRTNMQAGHFLSEDIQRELQGRAAFILLATPSALASYWVETELSAFRDLAAHDRTRIIIPVRIAHCELPLLLRVYKWIDAVHAPLESVIDQLALPLGFPTRKELAEAEHRRLAADQAARQQQVAEERRSERQRVALQLAAIRAKTRKRLTDDLSLVAILTVALLALAGLVLPLAFHFLPRSLLIGAGVVSLALLASTAASPTRRAIKQRWQAAHIVLSASLSVLLSGVIILSTLYLARPSATRTITHTITQKIYQPAFGAFIPVGGVRSSDTYGITGVVSTPDGSVWFTLFERDQIGHLFPNGTIAMLPIPTPNSGPLVLTIGPAGNVWFTESQSDHIGEIHIDAPSEPITEYSVQGNPQGIATGPDGNLWITDYSGNAIERFNPATTVVNAFPLPSPDNYPSRIVSGPGGRLWFTEWGTGDIASMTTSGVVTNYPIPVVPYTQMPNGVGPSNLAEGSDGNIWFTEYNENQLGRMTPDGAVTEFAIPHNDLAGNTGAYNICEGPDKNMWFTESDADQIGVITPTGQVTQFSVPYEGGFHGIAPGTINVSLWITSNSDRGGLVALQLQQ